MASMMCSPRFSVGQLWGANIPRTQACRLPALAHCVPLRHHIRAFGFSIRAGSSDLADPERLTGEDYYSETNYGYSGSVSGGSDSEGEAFSQSPGSLSVQLDAASQLSESVPSASVEQLEEDGGDNGNAGARGGGGRGGNNDGGDSENDGQEDKNKKKLSASQKLTLAYAVLVGVGGAIGYAKSKSVKSLASGAISTAILYYVYTQLPTNPVFASSLGLGISALLLGVMGARFKKSGKLFPAGIVSLVSLIMTGGYIHGIIRSSHA
ncbi:hypothetical protein GOP47_0004717 [Adiantum capillus-veneris]|uniref:Uncharacterized protein n=1 Tax=Adiantum capillus-veneris TaxID=13818 RepID=A0A9D4ZKQ1_ADICA|nr:hypothetical protein GOP47_0004717 [Adiantum capillus-veneris]